MERERVLDNLARLVWDYFPPGTISIAKQQERYETYVERYKRFMAYIILTRLQDVCDSYNEFNKRVKWMAGEDLDEQDLREIEKQIKQEFFNKPLKLLESGYVVEGQDETLSC